MKKILALLLATICAVVPLFALAGCGSGDTETEDVGAEIRAYFVGELYDFDPAKAYTNDEAMKIMSLIYEPLFTLDSNGTLQYGLAKSYRFYEYRGEYMLDIELRNTMWNDGSDVTASDVVYSWKRILDPDFPCQAASLLYEIKYARDAKLCNDKSVDDVAITDQNQTLTITFEEELDSEAQQNFLRNLTSIALAPVKESAVTRADRDDYWTKSVPYIVTNGPFAIRSMEYTADAEDPVNPTGHQFRLERNNYYRRDKGGLNSKDLYVTPYKFLTYWDTELDEAFEEFLEGTIFIAGDIPLEQREAYLSQARVSNMLSTYTYVFDNTDPVFSNAKVRRALAYAIDRQQIVTEVTKGLGVPATGFISHGVYNGAGGSFSAVTAASDYALSTSAQMDAAVALVESAVREDGYSGGSIRLLIRDNEEENAIADAVIEAWETLFDRAGVSVSILKVARTSTSIVVYEDEKKEEPIYLYADTIQEAYRVNDADTTNGFDGYNVVGIDYQMLSPDAFSALASFSYELSGNGIRMGGINPSETRTHVCGFNNAAYNTLMDNAYAEKDLAARTEILHEAEKLLLEEMPVMPILFNQSATLISGELDRVYTSYYGYNVYTRTEMRNYHSHLIIEAGDIVAE